ncbi:MAG TPA: histidine kinase dimerization/phospho-acceptor domain-containing protein, partial [Polyangiaceae bacterium]
MRGLTFRTKLLASHVGLVVAVIAIALLELNQTLVADLHRQLDERLVEQASGAAQWVSEGRRHPDKLAGRLALILKADVTIFDHAGAILGDASPHAPATHDDAQAPEVLAARAGGVGRASRELASQGEMHYVAVPAADGIVLRLGAPLSDIQATALAMQRRLLVASALAVVLAIALGFLAAQIAARPLRAMSLAAEKLARGDYDIELRSASPDEFGVLSRTLTMLAGELKGRIGELVTERDRLSAILAGMVEGVLVTDAEGAILLANPAAARILGGDAPLEGGSLESRVADPELRALLTRGGAGDATRESEVESGGRAIALYVRPLGRGSVTVLRDLTGMRRLLTLRRDFVANVSHELRTPVAAIQGYAE